MAGLISTGTPAVGNDMLGGGGGGGIFPGVISAYTVLVSRVREVVIEMSKEEPLRYKMMSLVQVSDSSGYYDTDHKTIKGCLLPVCQQTGGSKLESN